MSEHHKFRYLLPPGNNFSFVSKFRIWMIISIFLMAGAIGMLFVNKSVRGEYMNWTTDFKGGTEIIFTFQDPSNQYVKADAGKVREALASAGEDGFEVSEISWEGEDGKTVTGMKVVTPRFAALPETTQDKIRKDVLEKLKDRNIVKASWSGDRINIRSKTPVTVADIRPLFAPFNLTVKDWIPSETKLYGEMDLGTKEYNQWYGMGGLGEQFSKTLEKGLPNTKVGVYSSYGVGAKAGEKLRDDAAKAIVYAIFLIMLYLAFRFDVRYAPGAAFATIHDAVMVIGVFAVTWTDVSLVSVAGLLTVMGYSVNDTVIVFDRIRENQAKLKDKKVERIIDISINEMLVRTILTSSTVFATTLIMNIFGTGEVKNFAFAMNVGVIVGTYSSIFLAAPLFMWISKKWYSGPAPARRRPSGVAAPSAE